MKMKASEWEVANNQKQEIKLWQKGKRKKGRKKGGKKEILKLKKKKTQFFFKVSSLAISIEIRNYCEMYCVCRKELDLHVISIMISVTPKGSI